MNRRLGLAVALALGSTSCTAAFPALTLMTSLAQATTGIANVAVAVSEAEQREKQATEAQRTKLIDASRSQLDGTGCVVQVKNLTKQGWTLTACGRELECWPRFESYACDEPAEAPL